MCPNIDYPVYVVFQLCMLLVILIFALWSAFSCICKASWIMVFNCDFLQHPPLLLLILMLTGLAAKICVIPLHAMQFILEIILFSRDPKCNPLFSSLLLKLNIVVLVTLLQKLYAFTNFYLILSLLCLLLSPSTVTILVSYTWLRIVFNMIPTEYYCGLSLFACRLRIFLPKDCLSDNSWP